MKKTYIKPTTILHKIMGNQALLNASYIESRGANGVDGSQALSRESSGFWDDEEE